MFIYYHFDVSIFSTQDCRIKFYLSLLPKVFSLSVYLLKVFMSFGNHKMIVLNIKVLSKLTIRICSHCTKSIKSMPYDLN